MCGGGATIMQMRWRKTPQVSLDKLSDGQTIRLSGSVRHAIFRKELRYLRSQIVWQKLDKGTSGFSAHWLRTFHKACLKCVLPNQTVRTLCALEWSPHTLVAINLVVHHCCINKCESAVHGHSTILTHSTLNVLLLWFLFDSSFWTILVWHLHVSETMNTNLMIPEMWTT